MKTDERFNASTFDHYADARNSVAIAAQNMMKASDAPVPTRQQIDAAGGGVLGYLRALRALQRESQ